MFTVKRTGSSDSRLILRDGKPVGMALQLSNGKWGAFDMESIRLNDQAFASPTKVRRWFSENA